MLASHFVPLSCEHNVLAMFEDPKNLSFKQTAMIQALNHDSKCTHTYTEKGYMLTSFLEIE